MPPTDKPALRRAPKETELDVGEILSKRYGGISIYSVCILLLAAAIVWTGVRVAEQVQQYHQDYRVLQDMRKQHRKLEVEHQRLLIEQQTFSATPQIASRAVAELGMYSPGLNDKLILQPSGPAVPPAIPNTQRDSTVKAAPAANSVTSPTNASAPSDVTEESSAP